MIRCLFLTIVLLLSSQNVSWETAPAKVREAKASVYSFVVNDQSICTGFVVNAKLITAGHCAEDLEKTDRIFAYNSESNARYPLKLERFVSKWPAQDFAIFSFTDEKPEASLITTRVIPEIGDDVWTIEGPLGITPVLSRGIYSGRARVADDAQSVVNGMYFISLPAGPGASGSPVFDKQGRVWGILVGGNPRLPGFALVVLITN